jgi:hypothetical protein
VFPAKLEHLPHHLFCLVRLLENGQGNIQQALPIAILEQKVAAAIPQLDLAH